jgi:integrase
MPYKLNITIINGKKSVGKMNDGHGLYWRRNASGTVTAFQRINGKDIKLAEIKGKLDTATLNKIRHDGQLRKEAKKRSVTTTNISDLSINSESTFCDVWQAWLSELDASENPIWGKKTRSGNVGRVDNYVKPTVLYTTPIVEWTAQDVHGICSGLAEDTSKKLRGILVTVFSKASALGIINHNPAIESRQFKTATKVGRKKKYPALTKLPELRTLLSAIRDSDLDHYTRKAMELQAFTLLRTGELIALKWDHITDDKITVPRSLMKIKDRELDHIIPVTDEIKAILDSIRRTESPFLFPSKKGGHIGSETLSKAMRETLGMRDKMVPHGWRSAFKTNAEDAIDEDERPLFSHKWIEYVLDHYVGSDVEQAYMRAPTQRGIGLCFKWWSKQLCEKAQKSTEN